MLSIPIRYLSLAESSLCCLLALLSLLLLAFRPGARGRSGAALLLLSVVAGSIAPLLPIALGLPLFTLCAVLACAAFARDGSLGDEVSELPYSLALRALVVVIAGAASLLFYRLGNYSTFLLAWEGTTSDGFLHQMQSETHWWQTLSRQLSWGVGTLSAGHNSLLFSASAKALFHLFSVSALTLRLPSAVFFLLTCLLTFRILSRHFGPLTGLLGAVVLGYNEGAIMYGRYGSSVAATLFGLVLAFGVSLRLVSTLRLSLAVLSPITLFLASLGYAAARVPVAILAVTTLFGLVLNSSFSLARRAAIAAAFSAAASLLIFFEHSRGQIMEGFSARGEQMFAFSQAKSWPDQMQSLNTLLGPHPTKLAPGERLGLAFELARQVTGPQFLSITAPTARHGRRTIGPEFAEDPPFRKIMAPALAPFVLIGIVRLFWRRQRWLNTSLLLWIVGTSATILLTNRVDSNRTFFLLPPLIVWCAVGLQSFVATLERVLSRWLLFPVGAAAITFFAAVPVSGELWERSPSPPADLASLESFISEVPGPLYVIAPFRHSGKGNMQLALLGRFCKTGARGFLAPETTADALINSTVKGNKKLVSEAEKRLDAGDALVFHPPKPFLPVARAFVDRGAQARLVRRSSDEFLVLSKSAGSPALTLGEPAELPTPAPTPAPAAPASVAVLPVGKESVPLSSLKPLEIDAKFSPPQMNQSWLKGPLKIGDASFATGIGGHAATLLRYQVPAGALAFSASFGLDIDTTQCAPRGSITLSIRDEQGGILFQSPEVTSRDSAVPVAVLVSGKRELVLEIDGGEDGIDCDHFDLGDAVFLVEPGSQSAAPQPQGSHPACVCPAAR